MAMLMPRARRRPNDRRIDPPRALVLDACHPGVVLRAVLAVATVLAVGALYVADSAATWLQTWALATGAALPATLAWLLLVCSLQRWLRTCLPALQYALWVALGALAGLLACALLLLARLHDSPPWLAASASAALLAGALVAALVWRARALAPAAATARLAELQARIRPHFLFNTLNSAIALVRAEPARAEMLLEDLSDLFRHALSEPGARSTLGEEVALAQRYLAIEQVRFGERLRVQWQLDPAADGACLPPLLLQPLVENAVKHGVEPSPQGGKLRISTQRRGERAIVRITNTLAPESAVGPVRGHGIALNNVRERLALLHDVQAHMSVRQKNGLYQVRIALPCSP